MIGWNENWENLGKKVLKCAFSNDDGKIKLFEDLTFSGSEFPRVETATKKTWVPVWVLTLGTNNKWKPDERSSLGLSAKERMENR